MKLEAEQLYLETIKRHSLRALTEMEAFKLRLACAKIVSENAEINMEALLASAKNFLDNISDFMAFNDLEHNNTPF